MIAFTIKKILETSRLFVAKDLLDCGLPRLHRATPPVGFSSGIGPGCSRHDHVMRGAPVIVFDNGASSIKVGVTTSSKDVR